MSWTRRNYDNQVTVHETEISSFEGHRGHNVTDSIALVQAISPTVESCQDSLSLIAGEISVSHQT
jgi:hypothetical protein